MCLSPLLFKSIDPLTREFQLCSIAPMMDVTDKHYRYFMRLLTSQTLLYTEMRGKYFLSRLLSLESRLSPLASLVSPLSSLPLRMMMNNQHCISSTTVDSTLKYAHERINQFLEMKEPRTVLQVGGSVPEIMREAMTTSLQV